MAKDVTRVGGRYRLGAASFRELRLPGRCCITPEPLLAGPRV